MELADPLGEQERELPRVTDLIWVDVGQLEASQLRRIVVQECPQALHDIARWRLFDVGPRIRAQITLQDLCACDRQESVGDRATRCAHDGKAEAAGDTHESILT